MQQCIRILLFLVLNEAQHVSGNTTPIISSLKLHKQPLVLHMWKVVGCAVVGRCQVAYASLLFQFFFLFLLPNRHLYIVNNMCIYAYLTVQILCMNYYFYQIILQVKHFYTNPEGCEVLTGFCHWCASLAVTGWICDIGQDVVQSSFQTGSSRNPSSCHIIFRIAFLKEAVIRNM